MIKILEMHEIIYWLYLKNKKPGFQNNKQYNFTLYILLINLYKSNKGDRHQLQLYLL